MEAPRLLGPSDGSEHSGLSELGLPTPPPVLPSSHLIQFPGRWHGSWCPAQARQAPSRGYGLSSSSRSPLSGGAHGLQHLWADSFHDGAQGGRVTCPASSHCQPLCPVPRLGLSLLILETLWMDGPSETPVLGSQSKGARRGTNTLEVFLHNYCCQGDSLPWRKRVCDAACQPAQLHAVPT